MINPQRNRQLWVVSHVNQHKDSNLIEQALADLDAALSNDADAVVFINQWSSYAEVESVLAQARKRYPSAALGVNYLGDESEPYGFEGSFRLARDYGLQVVWTDFSGVDLIQERQEISLHRVEQCRPDAVFYCSGVHMKYSTLRDPGKPIEQSALQAMGWLDGVIITGPKTGVPCDPRLAAKVRDAIGPAYPLGVASGVSVENIDPILDLMDFFLVASSLENEHKRIDGAKVRILASKIH